MFCPEKGCCWVDLTGAIWRCSEKGWFGMVKTKSLFLREGGAFLHFFRQGLQ